MCEYTARTACRGIGNNAMVTDEHEQDRGSSAARKTRKPSSLRTLRTVVLKALRSVRAIQDALLRSLGFSVEARTKLVADMLDPGPNDAASYWLQLGVSIGIATLGLVVGSAAVIIGAMLVAPLMGPIIALAMGLAAGSPFLVLRSASRIVLSVAVTIGGAALITVMVPFHEVNAEIAARTSPTALDLLTAGFCALAGVYASLRPGSDTATTAAGTSIGISLVPPLCASGYGFGIGLWSVAGGAALLFLTNLVAILFVGTLSFVAAGFNRVDAAALERDELAKSERAVVTAAIARRLAGLFESKAGPALRFIMPLALLAAVYVPLRRALDEVAWQVRVRAAVQESIAQESSKVVETRVRVDRHQVEVLVVLLGTTQRAEAARDRLDKEIRAASGVEPRIEVLAIPDAKAFAGLESTMLAPLAPRVLPPAPPPLSAAQQLENTRDHVRSIVARAWPEEAAGEALSIGLAVDGELLRVQVVHLGAALGADGIESLSRSLGAALERETTLLDVAIPTEALTRAEGDLRLLSLVTAGVKASVAARAVRAGGAGECRRGTDRGRTARAGALRAAVASWRSTGDRALSCCAWPGSRHRLHSRFRPRR
jgi:uncharacterized hydrophobic protein (TIGR00271 family)